MYYTIRGDDPEKKFLEIVEEKPDGYEVKITSIGENYCMCMKDYMPRTLFNTCIRTGYLSDPKPYALSAKGA